MKIIVLLWSISIVLMGCSTASIYKKDPNDVFEPREYYRSAMSKEQIGIALTKKENETKLLLQEFKQSPHIRDIITLSHSGELLIAVKPAAYYQKNMDEVKSKLIQQLESKGIAATLVTDPYQFREVKKLKNKKYSIDLKDWELEWEQVLGKR